MGKKSYIIHPLLFALLPILSFYEHNINVAALPDLLWPLIFSFFGMVIIFALLLLFIKSKHQTALITSSALLLFYSYGHFLSLTPNLNVDGYLIRNHSICSALWLITMLGLFFLFTKFPFKFPILTAFFNFTGLIVLLILVPKIAYHEWRVVSTASADNSFFPADSADTITAASPDIYYLIFDQYAGAPVLQKYFSYNNSYFFAALEKKGFYVAAGSTANYSHTEQSLASSLNFSYLQEFSAMVGETYRDHHPIDSLLQNHRLAKILQAKGYRYLHFGSWWEPTSKNAYADENYNYRWLSNFSWAIYKQTPLAPYLGMAGLDYRLEQYQRVQRQFTQLKEVAARPEPNFVFAHILSPHPPFVFTPQGGFLTAAERDTQSWAENYADQVEFLNSAILDLTDGILNRSDNAPIIVIQSDHGVSLAKGNEDRDRAYLENRLPILNAYFVTEKIKGELYQTITPVNSFRLILNHLFDANYELLPDQNFFTQPSYPYRHYPVAELLND